MKGIAALLLALGMFPWWIPAQVSVPGHEAGRDAGFAPLTFDELVVLSSTAKPNGALAVRLDQVLTTAILNNTASAGGVSPHLPAVRDLGPVLRVVSWNIERGLNFGLIRAALTEQLNSRVLLAA